MHDPLQIEQAYQALTVALARPASTRWHLLAVSTFLDHLDDPTTAEPYLLELVPRLPALLHRFDPVGLAPGHLTPLLRYFVEVRSASPLLQDLPELDTTINTLCTATATLYAYAGDLHAALTTLSGADEPPPWLAALTTIEATPLKRLDQAVQAASEHNHRAAEMLGGISAGWHARLEPMRGSALAPVVEHAANGLTTPLRIGGLRRLRLELYGEREDSDDLRADVSVFGATTDREALLRPPLAAARRLLAETYPALANRFFGGQVRFEHPLSLHEGRSADSALAALFFCVILQRTRQRVQYHISSGAALTGQLTPEGVVQPVDEAALATKIQTAFFSWIRCLAVPAAQLPAAQAVLEELSNAYPHRRLDLVGVSHLRDVFYDRRLASYHQASLPRHIARQAWQRKFSLASLTIILLLTLAVGSLLYGPIDKNPIGGEYTGDRLVVKNKHGQIIDVMVVGERLVQIVTSSPSSPSLPIRGYVSFVDVNGDGQRDIIWAGGQTPTTIPEHTISCKEVGADTVLWSIPLRYQVDIPGHPEIGLDTYRVSTLATGDFDGDGATDLLVNMTHNRYFPGLVKLFDVTTAQELSSYAHTGWFHDMTVADLNEDGQVEIILGGINNAFDKKPVLAVLDPRRLAGHGPTQGKYALAGDSAAQEIAYLRLPVSQVSQQQGRQTERVDRVSVDHIEKELLAEVIENTLPQNGLILLVHFDFNLNPLKVGTSDRYDRFVQQLIASGDLSEPPDAASWQKYLNDILYWNGQNWQSEPVMNWPDKLSAAMR